MCDDDGMNLPLAEAIPQLLLFSPLTFTGLVMCLDPKYAIELVWLLADSIARFDRFLSTGRLFDLVAQPSEVPDFPVAQRYVRCAGVVVALLALAGVAGIPLIS